MTLPTIHLSRMTADQRKTFKVSPAKLQSTADKLREVTKLPRSTHAPNLANSAIRDSDHIHFCDDQGLVYKTFVFSSANKARAYNRIELKGRAYKAFKLAVVKFNPGVTVEDYKSWKPDV